MSLETLLRGMPLRASQVAKVRRKSLADMAGWDSRQLAGPGVLRRMLRLDQAGNMGRWVWRRARMLRTALVMGMARLR